ncbi:MAG: hypothetical protein JNM12_00015 [Alphaproteobacteria bacterium]|nr:hypothetical protein [Alphaproteobacteria bacterium]
MQSDIAKSCADHLRKKYSNNNAKLKATHAHEIVAAYFGYGSRAAMLSDTTYDLKRLSEAELIAPAADLVHQRLGELEGLPSDLPSAKDICSTLLFYLQGERFFQGEVWHDVLPFIQSPSNMFTILSDVIGFALFDTNANIKGLQLEGIDVIREEKAVIITGKGKSADGKSISVDLKLLRRAGNTAFSMPIVSLDGKEMEKRDPTDFFPKQMHGERNKEHIMRVTGGRRWTENDTEYNDRQNKILQIYKKIGLKVATAEDVEELARLQGHNDDDEFEIDLAKD